MIFGNLFGDRKFNRKLLFLTLPITLQNLMLALVAAADAVMLGKLDQDAMAAVSLATQIQFVQNMLLAAIVSSVAILGAQYWGKTVVHKLFTTKKEDEIYTLYFLTAVMPRIT